MTDEADWLGKVQMPDESTAVLRRDGRWSHPDEIVAAMLDANFNPGESSRLGLPAGWAAVSRAAAAFDGQAEFPFELPPPEEGELY